MLKLWQVAEGDRVATEAHTDAWWRGDRYGEIVTIGRKWVHVRMDRTGRVRKFAITGADTQVPGLRRHRKADHV